MISNEDSNDLIQEDILEYKKGGYHPVIVGECYLNRYTIISKLGWGQFSTVWLSKDNTSNSFTALKIQKSSNRCTEAAMEEIQILTKISKSINDPIWLQSLTDYSIPLIQRNNFIVSLLSHFIHKGTNGSHVCMVFEILGVNLLDLIKLYNYKGIPLPIVKNIVRQVLIGLDYLHRVCGVIHTDIKPENILLQLTQGQINELKNEGPFINKFPFDLLNKKFVEKPLIEAYQGVKKIEKRRYSKRDFFNNNEEEQSARSKSVSSDDREKRLRTGKRTFWNKDYEADKPRVKESLNVKIADLGNACWGKKHFSSVIQTRQYRAPEVILGMKYGFSADIWSLACMVIELITGEFLFDPVSGEDYNKNSDHLAQMWEILGHFPLKWAKTGKKYKKYFNSNGKLREIPTIRVWRLKDILIQKYWILPDEAESICEFVKEMLVFDPKLRRTARDCLSHKWLYEQSSHDYYLSEEEHFKFVLQEEAKESAGTAYL